MGRIKLTENAVKRLMRKLIQEIADSDRLAEIQGMVSSNPYLKNEVVDSESLLESPEFVLYVSQAGLEHIAERHSDPSKPGSTLLPSVDLKEVLSNMISMPPTESSGGRHKWLGVNVGRVIGGMGVSLEDPDTVESMQDYQMPDGRRETVKIHKGRRTPTSLMSLITTSLGQLSDGRELISIITAFPGGDEVDGVKIPMDRNLFKDQGLYFVVESKKFFLR